MIKKVWCIYMHTNKINGKKYIGQTFQNIEYRWRQDGSGYKGQPFYNAIEKYGWDNFEHKILKQNILSQEEANSWEIYYIKKYNTYNARYGYNATKGGNNNYILKCKSVLCNNIKYDSITECAKELDISPSILSSYLSKKLLPKELYYKQIHFVDEDFSIYKCYTEQDKFENRSNAFKGKNNPRALSVICDDVEYDTIKDFAKTYDLTPSLVSRWLDKSVNMPLKFIKLGLRYLDDSLPLYTIGINCKKKVSCDGIIFDSITDCAKHYQVDRKKISRYLNGDVKMKQEWIEKDLKYV